MAIETAIADAMELGYKKASEFGIKQGKRDLSSRNRDDVVCELCALGFLYFGTFGEMPNNTTAYYDALVDKYPLLNVDIDNLDMSGQHTFRYLITYWNDAQGRMMPEIIEETRRLEAINMETDNG